MNEPKKSSYPPTIPTREPDRPSRNVSWRAKYSEDGTELPLNWDDHPAAADMTHEQLLRNFRDIEQTLAASNWWKDFASSLRESMAQIDVRIATCVCFATGTMSGYPFTAEWFDPEGSRMGHDIALYQLAAFKGAVDVIGMCSSPQKKLTNPES